jgi:peptidoglycan/LPS O-acetylase OafA/YrhL
MSRNDVAERPEQHTRIRVPAADGFRGIAAVGVVADHCLLATGEPRLHSHFLRALILGSYMSLDVFFVLSGFLLFLPVAAAAGKFGSVKAYALRRAARILPAYYLVLLVTQLSDRLLVKVPLDYPLYSHRGLESLLLHATFLQHNVGLALGFSEGFGVNGVVWTLSIDALFYVLLPIVALRYFRHPLLGLIIALGLTIGWRVAVSHLWIPLPHLRYEDTGGLTNAGYSKEILITQFPDYLVNFAAGMTAAWLLVKLRRERLVVPPGVTVVVQVLALAAVIWGVVAAGARDIARTSGPLDHWTGTTPVTLAFAVLLLATALAPRWAQFPVNNRAVRRLSDISYGLYLWHLIFVGFALETLHWLPDGTNGDFVRMFALALGGGLVMGWASYVWIEQPMIRWARRRSRTLDGPRGVQAVAAEVPAP